jgi:hypothetical protein
MLGLVGARCAAARAAARSVALPSARREQRRGLKNKNPFIEEFDNLHSDMHKTFDIRKDNVVALVTLILVIPSVAFYLFPEYEYNLKGAVDVEASYRRRTAGVELPSAAAAEE